jgi:hypothetical protein
MKCRNIEARDLAHRLVKGATITREIAAGRMTATRSTRTFCSNACRQAAYRAR